MRTVAWIHRHRGLAAFGAGVLLTLLAFGAVGYLVLSDQRRSARVLSAALSEALAREVRIERVTDLGTQRIVLRGVRLPKAGGWPVEVVAERVEATGPLLLAARGGEAPLSLVVTRPIVETAGGGAGIDVSALDRMRETLASFLSAATLLDVTLTGGSLRSGGGDDGDVEFDLVLRKGRGDAKAELGLRRRKGEPLALTADARLEGQVARVSVTGRGRLAPVLRWLPSGTTAGLAEQVLALRLALELAPSASVLARGTLALGDAVAMEGEATVRDGVLGVALSRLDADLGVAAAAAGLGWRPDGRAELRDVTMSWRPGAGGLPTLAATVHVRSLGLPAAGIGADIAAEDVEGRVTLEPAAGGSVIRGEGRVGRLSAAGLEVAPAHGRYRLSLDANGAVTRADLDELTASVAGAVLRGSLGYDVSLRRAGARLRGETVEVAGLIRRVAPGWLGDGDRLRVAGLRLTVTGLDPVGVRAGTVQLDARGLALRRPDGEVLSEHLAAGVTLGEPSVVLAVEADRVRGSVPPLRGAVPRVAASIELRRRADGGLDPSRGTLVARDREGRELLAAELRPAAPGRVTVSAAAPDLARLGDLWPEFARRLHGAARLDVELAGEGFRAADGRLALRVTEGELLGGKVSVRALRAEVPIRRGVEMTGEPPWGTVEVSELIGYGVVARDVTTPARIFRDRLALNDLAYALYSGTGKGWVEVELEPAGPVVRGELTGSGVRMEEFMSAYGVRGGTMTGLLRYALDVQYRAGRVGVNGHLEVPEGGAVNIELLNRLLAYAGADPSGVLRSAIENLRAFEYKSAVADVQSGGGEIRVSLALKGRERFGIFPPRVREINVRNMPLGFLARQFPGG